MRRPKKQKQVGVSKASFGNGGFKKAVEWLSRQVRRTLSDMTIFGTVDLDLHRSFKQAWAYIVRLNRLRVYQKRISAAS